MTAPALGPGVTRRRVLFGLLDADSWSWASIKAMFWFVLIILLLGYIPDRAYYFTVFSTIDLGINAISPINLCPPENRGLPCPAPVGAALPFDPSPQELSLPAPRTDGAVVQSGTRFLYIGGTDGTAPSADVFAAEAFAAGTYGPWAAAPALPEPRSRASVIFSAGTVYVLGGMDANGRATTTAWAMTPDAATGALTEWQPAAEELTLPEARAGASVVALADGLLLIGGVDAEGSPARSVWKSTLDDGEFGAWAPQTDLPEPRADAEAAVTGSYVFVFGGRDASGPTATVLRGHLPAAPDAAAEPSAAPVETQIAWAAGTGTSNLPAPRTEAAGFIANGGLYLIGGSDGTNVHNELYWAIPDAQGNIPEWKHLEQSDLPEPGLAGSAAVVSGANAYVLGGRTADAVITGAARTNLAPQPPFFQLGLFGATIPALKIEGEVGQQLGYLAAAGVATGNFILLIIVGWAFAHPQRTRELVAKVRNRGRRS